MVSPNWLQHSVLIAGVLFFGSYNVLNMKWQFSLCIQGIPRDDPSKACPEGGRLFNKPWAQTWFMFLGEFWVLGVYKVQRHLSARRRGQVGKQPRVHDEGNMLVFALPAACDVAGTGLSAIGMMFVPASVYQMMRSSVILFTAGLTKCFLGKTLRSYHFLGLFVVTTGLTCVGVAAVLSSKDDTSRASSPPWLVGVGIGLVLLSQLASAFQGVFEEHLLQGQKMSAKRTLGLEGFWGLIIQGLLLVVFCYIPGSDNGVEENLPDSIAMLRASPELSRLMWSSVFSVGMCNICCLTVTKRISAVTRCLVDGCRTLVVWAVSLALFYGGYSGGSAWNSYCWLQLVGFVLLVLGTLLYNAVLKAPGLEYPLDVAIPAFARRDDPPPAAWSPHFQNAWHKGLDDAEFSPPNSPSSQMNSPALAEPLLDQEDAVFEVKGEF